MTDEEADRSALRELMSELSEDAYCAGWHINTEYALWEILQGVRVGWAALSDGDPRIDELRRLHEVTDGWWRWNPEGDGAHDNKELVTTAVWLDVYARKVNDKDRWSMVAVGGRVLRGGEARDAAHNLRGPLLSKAKP